MIAANLMSSDQFLQISARDRVVGVVKDVFSRHGAVPMSSLDVGFVSSLDLPLSAVQVLKPCTLLFSTKFALQT